METAAQLSEASKIRQKSRMLSRYRPLFPIGRGGMGSVEIAIEKKDSGFQRIVALKRLLPESRDERHTEMFLREARLAALLSHPNVVHAFDFGEEENGELYLAMEYVEGASLARTFSLSAEKKDRLPPALFAWVLAEVCEGLHAVHQLRDVDGTALHVVHRDVSPQNVMLSFDGHVKVLDFGVAKMERDQALSRTGEVKGKLGYMSPEQALGEPVDARSDLFAVGAILYEGLTGRRMWGDGTDMDVMRKLALGEPPPLEGLAGDPDAKAPPELNALYKQLVARRAEDRPASAREVADVLRAYANKEGPIAPQRVLAEHVSSLFADEATSRREELRKKLDEAAPGEEGAKLRESLTPPSQPSNRTPGPSQAPTREMRPEDEESEAEEKVAPAAPAPSATRSRLSVALIGMVVIVGSAIVWKLVRPEPTPVTQVNGTAPIVFVPATANPTTSATTTASTNPTNTNPTPSATARASASAPRMPPTNMVRPPLVLSSAATQPSTPPSAKPPPPRPSSSVPDVDPHPF